jgi:diacylglycerol O-acyltransferase-1
MAFTIIICWFNLFVCFVIVDFLYSELFRYGIRVDPEQWLIVLTGRHEGGADHPSVILLMCMYLLFSLYKPFLCV